MPNLVIITATKTALAFSQDNEHYSVLINKIHIDSMLLPAYVQYEEIADEVKM